MNRGEAARLLATISVIHERSLADEATAAAWADLLADVAYPDAAAALRVCLRTSPHPPKPADLLAVMAEAKAATPEWEAAWAEVMAAIKTWGTYLGHGIHPAGKFPGWSSRQLAAAIAHVGGYEAICAAEMDHLPTIRAQFRDFFRRERDAEIHRLRAGESAPLPAGNLRRIGGGS